MAGIVLLIGVCLHRGFRVTVETEWTWNMETLFVLWI